MEALFWAAFGAALDNPDLQEKLTGPAAAFVKSKVPGAADKAIGDLLCRMGKELGGA